MKIIAQTNKEFLCIICKSWLYVADRSNVDHSISLVCRSANCKNKGILVKVKLLVEEIDVEELERIKV